MQERRSTAKDLTLLRDVEPDGLVVKGVLVCVEAFQRVFVCGVFAVHRGIVLVTEDDARARHAFA